MMVPPRGPTARYEAERWLAAAARSNPEEGRDREDMVRITPCSGDLQGTTAGTSWHSYTS